MGFDFEVIAVDFDGTLCENAWPEIGAQKKFVFKYLQYRRNMGAKIILWTCRVGERLQEAVDWCAERGLIFDKINENIPEVVAAFGTESRKIFAHEYIDDRNKLLDGLEIELFLETLSDIKQTLIRTALHKALLDFHGQEEVDDE